MRRAFWMGLCVAVATPTAVMAGRDGNALFTEEATLRGIEYLTDGSATATPFGKGLAFVDLDRDGDPDVVLLGRSNGVVGVYENDGRGYFTDRTALSGIPVCADASAVTAADYDGDGDLDLYVSQWRAANRLLRNDGGFQFTDVAASAGVDDVGAGTGCAWGDVDLDGWLDLYVANRTFSGAPSHNRLYRNLGDGTFLDVAPALGVDDDQLTFQPVLIDFDGDGDADLYLSTDKGSDCVETNRLFKNQDGQFLEITESSGTEACIDSMGVAVGDFDGNGAQDIYCTNVPFGNPLFLNQDDGAFTESSAEAGVESFAFGWGAWFFDHDNDGRLDLYVCNQGSANRLYRNVDPWPCLDLAPALGLDDTDPSFCMATGDADGDGDLDLLVQNQARPVKLFINGVGQDRRWIRFNIAGPTGNPDAVGAQVRVRTGTQWQIHEVFAGSSYKSQNELTLHFGVDGATIADEVVVQWPGGATRTLVEVPTNQEYTISPAVPGDVTGDSVVNVEDLLAVVTAWGKCARPPAPCAADLTGDGVVDVADLLAVLVNWS